MTEKACILRILALFVVVILPGVGSVYADGVEGASTPYTPGALRAELLYLPGAGLNEQPAVGAERRIIPLAFGLSAVVPGAGQVYNRQWIKAAVSVALEVALVAGYFSWRQRGLDGEDAYQAYAHAHWNPVKYARWVSDYSDWLDGVDRATINIPEGIDFRNPALWTPAERSAAQRFFSEIRAVEDRLYHPDTGASFSHKLPYFGEQQYYELIGKYFQFSPGWDEYPAWTDGEAFTGAIDPETAGPDRKKVNVPEQFYNYARDHAHTNDLLRTASRVSALVIVNHLVAAIDAAVFAKIHNDRLSARVELGYMPSGRAQPVATLRYAF